MRLFSYNSLANKVGDGTDLPSRIKIFNWGVNKTLKGDVIVNDKTAKVFSSNQKAMGRDTIVLDFEHNTVPKTPEYERTKEPRPVAGHFIAEVVMGDGVYLAAQDWTADGQASARNYKDLSPAPYVDDDGVLIGLHSCALTQTGAVFDLTFLNTIGTPVESDLCTLSASMGIQVPDAYKLALTKAPAITPNPNMNEHINVFRKALGMDGKTDEEVLKCMSEEVKGGKWTRKGPLDNLPGADSKVIHYSAEQLQEIVAAQLKPLVASLEASAKARADAVKDSEQKERDAIVKVASDGGKVIPLTVDEIKELSPKTLRAMVEKLPKTVQMDRSPMARIRNGEEGKIKNGPSRGVTLSVGGVPVTIDVPGAAPAPQLTGLARAAAAFQSQYDNRQSN
jgi:hypothetical protein